MSPGFGIAQEREILRNAFEDLLYVVRQAAPGREAALLACAGLTPQHVHEGRTVLSFDVYYALLDQLQETCWLPLAALQLGLRRGLQDFGLFGRALRATASYGEALRLAQYFFTSAWNHVRLEVLHDSE